MDSNKSPPPKTNALASAFRSAGLSFADVGFLKLNFWFPVLLVVAHLSVVSWCKSSVATSAVAMMPVPPAKVPFFVITAMPIIAIMCTVVALMSVAAIKPKGTVRGRNGSLAAQGLPAWLDRVQQAQYNTWEACICTVSTFYVAASLDLSEALFAKMATLLLLIRVLYPIVYGLDLDFLRTTLWLMGIHTCLMTAFAGLFAESVVPMLT